jgi:hypothetical protein
MIMIITMVTKPYTYPHRIGRVVMIIMAVPMAPLIQRKYFKI